MILSEREIDGYPGCNIRIESDNHTFYVYVEDELGTQVWEPHDGKAALDMFKHPFAYGYVAPEREVAA